MTLLALNWKMNKTPAEAAAWARELRAGLAAGGPDLAVVPSFVALPAVAEALAGSGVAIGAQDVSAHASGAYTGEVSAAMLADLGVSHAVVGHSERRTYHFESDTTVAAKARAAQTAGLTPIVCVGEALAIRETGRHVEVTLAQLDASLEGVEPEKLVIAYEPVWAIGTGKTATAADAEDMAAAIRGALVARYGDAGRAVAVLYGGSVKPDNVAEIMRGENVGGALVGGASLDLASVRGMIAALS